MMDKLCDEVLQLIFFELNNPTSLALTCKRFLECSRDPYVRAHYFLARYGRQQAMFMALGRGKLLSERVLDIMVASGANMSRYLVQLAIHHYFRSQAHFIKSPWCRKVPQPVFFYFMMLGSRMFGEIPVGKGEDDGTLFTTFLKESRLPSELKTVKWERIHTIMETYKFIPFAAKDPIMAQFPLALAVEPQLLPLAITNGFKMDTKYRDFVFRKMFERPSDPANKATRCDDIVHNVRELCRLDPSMFLSRTVAAEICMEAKSNEHAYNALKKLDECGDILFELSTLVQDLLKLFVSSRSVTVSSTVQVLHHLYRDFPSTDATARLVMLLTIFLDDAGPSHTTPDSLHAKLESLGLTPLSRRDVLNIMINPFVDKHGNLLEYARLKIGLNAGDIRFLVEEVAVKCLEIGCKGRTLQKMQLSYPCLRETVAETTKNQYDIELENLPPSEDAASCRGYWAKLNRDYHFVKFAEAFSMGSSVEDTDVGMIDANDGDEEEEQGDDDLDIPRTIAPAAHASEAGSGLSLGQITQDTLSAMIRRDENTPLRGRSRRHLFLYAYQDTTPKYSYPADALPVGAWVKELFGNRHRVTAIFMTHAILNDNHNILSKYVGLDYKRLHNSVPVTLKHFKMLGRLGRAPNFMLWRAIENGADFFTSEEDYLSGEDAPAVHVKSESSPSPPVLAQVPASRESSQRKPQSPRGRKRPRRSAASHVISYAELDSDDEDIDEDNRPDAKSTGQKRTETSLQQWIKHLSVLLKDEERKYKEVKKELERTSRSTSRHRVHKNDFFRSLAAHLRTLRQRDSETASVEADDHSDEEDREYRCRSTKRRRTTAFA